MADPEVIQDDEYGSIIAGAVNRYRPIDKTPALVATRDIPREKAPGKATLTLPRQHLMLIARYLRLGIRQGVPQ